MVKLFISSNLGETRYVTTLTSGQVSLSWVFPSFPALLHLQRLSQSRNQSISHSMNDFLIIRSWETIHSRVQKKLDRCGLLTCVARTRTRRQEYDTCNVHPDSTCTLKPKSGGDRKKNNEKSFSRPINWVTRWTFQNYGFLQNRSALYKLSLLVTWFSIFKRRFYSILINVILKSLVSQSFNTLKSEIKLKGSWHLLI